MTTRVCLLCALLCGTAAGVPFSALRFASEYSTPSNWPGMRAALAANPRAFDEVWMSTGITFPKLAWHADRARQCAAVADDLRKLGIVPSIEIQTVLGHGDALLGAGDCSGQTWSTWVGSDGTVAKRCSCPSDPALCAYFVRVAELHAAWKPGSIWLDDDFTLKCHAPVRPGANPLMGCFCDRCIGIFSKREGREWTRAELDRSLRTDATLMTRWLTAQAGVFARVAREIAAAVHRISPDTVFGYQFGGTGAPAIAHGLYEGSGHPVRLRPGSGAYWDTDAHEQIEKAYELQVVAAPYGRPEWVESICPEIETCPRTFCSRTPQGLILEAFENLSLGMDFISMFAADARTDESPDFYRTRLFPRLDAARPFLEGFRDANRGAKPCGFTVANDVPAKLVACRGVPIVPRNGRSLGALPDVLSISVRTAGSAWIGGLTQETRVMQCASSMSLEAFYRRCDETVQGRLPVLFEKAAMAFVVPNVREDGSLATVAFVNASIDRQDPTPVRLRGVPASAWSIFWHAPEEAPVRLTFAREGGDVRLTLPRIGAWQCGYLSFGD